MPDPALASPPAPPRRPPKAPEERLRRMRLLDALIGRGITAGGITIVLAVLGIFVFVFAEALPLLYPVRVSEKENVQVEGAGGRPLAVGEDEYRETGWVFLKTEYLPRTISEMLRVFDQMRAQFGAKPAQP